MLLTTFLPVTLHPVAAASPELRLVQSTTALSLAAGCRGLDAQSDAPSAEARDSQVTVQAACCALQHCTASLRLPLTFACAAPGFLQQLCVFAGAC